MRALRTVTELAEFFAFLDILRKSGATNMYGGGPYLEEEFGISLDEARDTLAAWMRTFGDGTLTPEERAKIAAETL